MSKRIKILFTIPNFDTAGSGKVVYDLVKGLDTSRLEMEVCCFHGDGSFFKAIEDLGVKIHLFEFATPYRPYWSLPVRIYKIFKFFKSEGFDLIHSWHWSSDFTEPLAAKLAGIPFVYTKKAMGWGNKAWIWRSMLSTKIIAINKDMLEQFFKNMPYKVDYMPLGVDTDYFKPQLKSHDLMSALAIKDMDFVVITVANLVPVKGIEILIEAIKKMQDTSIKLLVVGNHNNDYGKDLQRLHESSHIRFLGKQEDVRPYLAISNVFVIPTKNEGRKEGLPVAPLEAMASGKIVLGSDISGINDILKDFNNHLFEPSNIVELVNKINLIKNMSNQERKTLEDRMRTYVAHHFSLTQCIKRHQEFYLNLPL